MAKGILAVLFLTCLSFASMEGRTRQFKVKIDEGGKVFTQVTRVNVRSGFEYFHVPKHGKVDETTVVVDYKKKLVLTRVPRINTCYLRKYSKDDASPRSLLFGMKKEKVKITWHKYMTSNTNEMIVRKATSEEMDSKPFKKLCGKRNVYFMIPAPYDKKGMEKLALKIVKGQAGRKTKRDNLYVREFTPCDDYSGKELARCMKSKNGKTFLQATGRFKFGGCIYTAHCHVQSVGYYCQHVHKYSAAFCCDFKCWL